MMLHQKKDLRHFHLVKVFYHKNDNREFAKSENPRGSNSSLNSDASCLPNLNAILFLQLVNINSFISSNPTFLKLLNIWLVNPLDYKLSYI
jgi:hypothetical protein